MFLDLAKYCAVDPKYSQGLYWGDTNTLFVFFILCKCYFYELNTHHIVKNPSHNEMYMVPILIATFNNLIPLEIDPHNVTYLWKFKDDSGFKPIGTGQSNESTVQFTFEKIYQNFRIGISQSKFTYSFE